MPPDNLTSQLETEWQFDAVDLRPVEQWLNEAQSRLGFAASSPADKQLRDTYFDTADWRIHRAGYALRLRQKGEGAEATLKSMEGAVDNIRRRREFTEQVDGDGREDMAAMPGEVGERVRLIAGARPIRPLFEIRNHRRTFKLNIGGAGAELALDDTTIPLEGEGEPFRLQRVEIETGEAEAPALQGLIEALRSECGLQPAGMSKFELGLFAHGLKPAGLPDLGPTQIEADQTAGQVAFAVLRRHFAAFLAHESGARLGEDPEEVHDMRVATRRLRAAIRLFEPALPRRAQALSEQLRWMAEALGEVRDLDVQLEQIQAWIEGADEAGRAGLQALPGLLEAQRQPARRRLIRALDSRRFERLVAAFTSLLRRGPPRRSPAARVLIAAAGPGLVESHYLKVSKKGKKLTPESRPEEYHALRIQCKRLRYCLEFLSGVYGKPAQALARQLVKVQDVLGKHQDAYVAADHLRALSQAHGRRLSTQTTFAMGQITERSLHRAAALRAEFPEVFEGLEGKPWRRLQETMEAKRAATAAPFAPRPRAKSPSPTE